MNAEKQNDLFEKAMIEHVGPAIINDVPISYNQIARLMFDAGCAAALAELKAQQEIESLRAKVAELESVISALAKDVDGSYVIIKAEQNKAKVLADALGRIRDYMKGYQAAPANAVPDGWKLVPVEPTRSMLDAGHCDLTMEHGIDPMLKYAYSQMIDASPSPDSEKS